MYNVIVQYYFGVNCIGYLFTTQMKGYLLSVTWLGCECVCRFSSRLWIVFQGNSVHACS